MEDHIQDWSIGGKFVIAKAYDYFRRQGVAVKWDGVVWDSSNTPKHAFILWMAMLGKLSTYDRLHFIDVESDSCSVCVDVLETHEHLFF